MPMIDDKLKKLMALKKGKPELSPLEQKAKIGVVSHLRQLAGDAIKDRMTGMKKVSVESDSKDGLAEGLETAEDLIKKHEGGSAPAEMDMDSDEMSEDMDLSGEEVSEDLSPEARIASLEKQLMELQARLGQ